MSFETLDHTSAHSLLSWHIAMGVDEVIADAPQDRFKQTADAKNATTTAEKTPVNVATAEKRSVNKPEVSTTQGPVPITARPALPTTGAGIDAAKKAAASCANLADLKAAIEAFDGGVLKRQAKHSVFASGNPESPVMVIGDVPETEDDNTGSAFVGPAGQLLDKMLAAIKLSRSETAYLTHFIPWRPLGKAVPDPQTVAMLKPFVEKHIALSKPQILVLLGGLPMKAFFDTEDNISRQRGRWKDLTIAGHTVPTIALYHPDRLISQPLQKAAAWQDLLSIQEKYKSL